MILTLRGTSFAQKGYSAADIRGETKACENTLYQKKHPFQGCEPQEHKALQDLSSSLVDFDKGLAVDQIKKNIKVLSEVQIKNSLGHLQKVGVPTPDSTLSMRLQSLEKEGFKISKPQEKEVPELSQKYLLASLRYRELKKLSNNKLLNAKDRDQLNERISLLEARYPLVAGHGFVKLGAHATAMLKASEFIPKETPEESMILDNFLFNGTPRKISDLNIGDMQATSTMGQITKHFTQNKNPRIATELQSVLNEELQHSLSNQLFALQKLKNFSKCETMTLHSEVTLAAINSSSHPEAIFNDLCECHKDNAPIPESALLVTGLLSGAAGLFCVLPTGVGQVIACPTAAAAGWTTAAGSAINTTEQLSRYNSYEDQGRVLDVLESGQENPVEKALLTRKEAELSKEIVHNNMLGLIGFGVGHVGFSSLTKLYQRSQVSKTLAKLSPTERKKIEDSLASLNKEDQSRAFVVLEQLDDETRTLLLQKPHLLNQQMKGLRCEI